MVGMKRINVLIEKDTLDRAIKYKKDTLIGGRAIGWQINKGLKMFLDKEEKESK